MSQLFDPTGFMPRSQCGPAWTQQMIATQQMAHTIIFLCYVTIAVALFFGVGVPRDKLGRWLFAAFILSCAGTHLTSRFMFQWPVYRLDTLVLAICAGLSTACVVWLLLVGTRDG